MAVLVDGASMPNVTDLPEDLKLLVRRNALPVTDTNFDVDCQRLVTAIRQGRLSPRVVILVVLALVLIVGLIWFAGSKLDNRGRETTLVTPTPKPTPKPPTQEPSKTDFKTYYYHGVLDYKNKDYRQAISDLNEAIRLNPNYSYSYYDRGNVYRDMQLYQQAISDYNVAINLDPNYPYAYHYRVLCYQKQGNIIQAKADLAKAKQLGYP
jgi:tetratricopeptide (TPR) repeat protein